MADDRRGCLSLLYEYGPWQIDHAPSEWPYKFMYIGDANCTQWVLKIKKSQDINLKEYKLYIEILIQFIKLKWIYLSY